MASKHSTNVADRRGCCYRCTYRLVSAGMDHYFVAHLVWNLDASKDEIVWFLQVLTCCDYATCPMVKSNNRLCYIQGDKRK